MSNIKKELIDFETHCFETGQLQVGELMSTAIMHIAELEKELSSIVSGIFSENELAILKLEQQAKALFDFEVNENIGSVACDQVTQSLKDKSYEFSNQAKALKETK
jgi:hypothetical protein